MDAAPDTRRQLGQLMVEEGLLSADELTRALQEQSQTGKPLGETLVALGYASPGAVANALAEQHGGLLRTEYGVSTGLSAVPEGERPALHAAPPVAPLSAPASGKHANESDAPLGAGLRLARPAGAADSLEAPAVAAAPAPAAPAPSPAPAEEQGPGLAKFASLHADLDTARAELQQKSAHLTELTGRLDETVSQLRVSQAARDAFAAKAAELEAQAEAAPERDPAPAARVQELEQSVTDLQAKLTEAAEAAAAAQPDPAEAVRVVELQAQVEELTKAVAAAEERGQAETARSQSLEAQLQTVAAGRDALVENVADLQAKLTEALAAPAPAAPDPAATARIEELEAQLQSAAADRDALAQSVGALQAKLMAAEAPAASDPLLTARVQELETQLQAATVERDGLVQSLTELQTRLGATADSREAELARAHAVAAARATAVESQLQAVETERNALAQSFEELQGLLSRTTAAHGVSLDKLEEQLAEREQRLAQRADETARVEREHRAALDQSELERNALADRFEELQGLLNETTAAHETAFGSLEEQLASRERLLSSSTDETARLTGEHGAALEQLQGERDGLAQSSAKLEEQLADRERRLAENVNEIARMNREHRAALDELARELEEERARVAEEAAAAVEPDETAHVLLVPASTGYTLLERTGPAPDRRAVVEIGRGSWGEGRFIVSRIGPSPLPAGPRRCAFLECA